MCITYFDYLPDSLIKALSLDDDYNGINLWKYDPQSRSWNDGINDWLFVFTKNNSITAKKWKIKNFVKSKTPAFLYEPLRKFWVKFLR